MTTPAVLAPGVHLGVDEKIYHADPAPGPSLSAGIACRLLQSSALHAKTHHPRLWDEPPAADDGSVTDGGQLAHAMLLGGLERIVPVNPGDFPGKKGGVPVGWTNDAIKAERDRIRGLGKVPVLKDQYDRALPMVEAARVALLECELGPIKIADGDCEVTIVADDGPISAGKRFFRRARPDWWSKDRAVMFDYKSTAGLAEPSGWIRKQLVPMGYDIQRAHYRRSAMLSTGKIPRWFFFVQENFPPFACSFVDLDGAHDEIAEQKMDYASQLWKHHLAKGEWPGYSRKIHYSMPSTWEMAEHELTLERRIQLGAQG
jgi:hypothetical protein